MRSPFTRRRPELILNSVEVYSKVRWPTWSPAGNQIAFVLEPYAVKVQDCDQWYPCILVIAQQEGSWGTTHAISLANTNVGTFQYVESLQWGRTDRSKLLVFSGAGPERRGKSGVYILDITTSAVSRVLSGGKNPVWSPDDQWIAWVKTRGDQLMLYSDLTGNSYKVASGVRDPDWRRIQ